MDGFINLVKPPKMTSSDAVVYVRRRLPKGTKVGHGGTLDPDAAGVLPICVGKAARLFDYIIDKEKEYVAEAVFGITTDTQDAAGRIVLRRPGEPGADEIRAALKRLEGTIEQIPPAYSAIKRDGHRLYQLARQGQEVEIQARPVHVKSLDYLGQIGYNRHMIRIVCGKGVYVRTLVHDLGEMLGCGAHMSFLLRTKAGAFCVEKGVTLEEISEEGAIEDNLCPPDMPLAHIPEVRLDQTYLKAVSNGNRVPCPEQLDCGTVVRVYVDERFAGMAQLEEGMLKFRAMLL